MLGCATHRYAPLNGGLQTDPDYYQESTLPFVSDSAGKLANQRPHRLWRLILRWDPAADSSEKIVIRKEFQLLLWGQTENTNLDTQIQDLGGVENYFLWMERQFQPLSDSDKLVSHTIEKLKDHTILKFRFVSQTPQPRSAELRAQTFWVPELYLETALNACMEEEQEAPLPAKDGFGIELVLVSRTKDARAKRWNFSEMNFANDKRATLKTWSVGGGTWVSYRAMFQMNVSLPRCPLLPELQEKLLQLVRDFETSTGIDW